jgi:two-component system cell cycle response regulator DivK
VNERILIVEDHPLHMKLMEMALRGKNYTLLKATDGEAALDLATSQRPDLILMDIRLPKMDGFQVTKKLRENPEFSDTPIIALTAHAMAGDRESVIKSGCNAYLSKPIDTRELLEMIAETPLKRKHQSNDGEK